MNIITNDNKILIKNKKNNVFNNEVAYQVSFK